MFGENIDKFKRNRKSRTSPPRWFLIRDLDIVGTKYKRWNSRVERMESFLRERSKERILNWGNFSARNIWGFEGHRSFKNTRASACEHYSRSFQNILPQKPAPACDILPVFLLFYQDPRYDIITFTFHGESESENVGDTITCAAKCHIVDTWLLR